MFIFGQKSFGQEKETKIYMGTGNSNFVQLYLGEGVIKASFSSLNSNQFVGITFQNSNNFINLQLGYFACNYSISKHSANTSSSPFSSRHFLQMIETKAILGVTPLEFGKRFRFTPQFSLGFLYTVKGTSQSSTYHPGLATPNNGNYVYSNEKIKIGVINLLFGLQSNYQVTDKFSLFITNEFGFTTLKDITPVTFYNSIGISYNFKNE